MNDYEKMIQLGKIKNIDMDLERESLEIVAKYRKMQFDAFRKAGFTKEQSIFLVKTEIEKPLNV